MRKLKNKKELILYAISPFGLHILNIIVSTYLINSFLVDNYVTDAEQWIYSDYTVVSVVLFAILVTFSKIIANIVDVPIAIGVDKIKSHYGRRRPAILIGLIITFSTFVLLMVPISQTPESIGNTIWFSLLLFAFYISYVMTLVSYYATFSEITKDEKDFAILTKFKISIDAFSFLLAYTLVPIFISFGYTVRGVAFLALPLSLMMIIPLFMIKEKSSLPQDSMIEDYKEEEIDISKERYRKLGIRKSFLMIFKNKVFVIWIIIFTFLQISLQLFMVSETVYFSGSLFFNGFKIALITLCVFLPIPLTNRIYKSIARRFGFKIAFIYSLAIFIIAIILMIGIYYVKDETTKLIFGVIAALISSFGIGSFFSIGLVIPATISKIEYKRTGISYFAMFVGIESIVSNFFASLATGALWLLLRHNNLVRIVPVIIVSCAFVALLFTFLLPKELSLYSKELLLEED